MKVETFNKRNREFFEKRQVIMDTKGAEYAGSEDKFANFRRIAGHYGVPVELVWAIYCEKHWDSIRSFIKKRVQGLNVSEIEAGLSEPIDGRIADAENYLDILKGIVDEERELER